MGSLKLTVFRRFRTNFGPSEVGFPIGRGKSMVMEGDDADALVLLLNRLELWNAIFGVHGPAERIDNQQISRGGGFDEPHEGGGTSGIGAGSLPLADEIRINGLELKDRYAGGVASEFPELGWNARGVLIDRESCPGRLNTAGTRERFGRRLAVGPFPSKALERVGSLE